MLGEVAAADRLRICAFALGCSPRIDYPASTKFEPKIRSHMLAVEVLLADQVYQTDQMGFVNVVFIELR